MRISALLEGRKRLAEGGNLSINGHIYTVAPDANGLPIGYIKV
jgi:hypothetical protein